MHSNGIIYAALAALSMVSTVAAVKCSADFFCNQIDCSVPYQFPSGCGDGRSGTWGVHAEACGYVDCNCATNSAVFLQTC
ncbi:unnamed protein product [Clonostachys rhizophaga]|uniref:Uncharacterized protein n=1 Tax=Clonostachys rhizophaga TaxID=160324 RepID=A0A9N9YKV9_9HYPO|nr:unnamed protein product [Clonostachys rhizophaga]